MNALQIHIYADGAHRDLMIKRHKEGIVKGFTTNPSLMAQAGVKDYVGYAKELLTQIPDMPISFEVFSDEWPEMERQALLIGSWGKNVYIKIPITNTKSEPALPLIRRLLDRGLRLNVTAIFTQQQLDGLREILKPQDDVLVSIFAGRLADTGFDPMPLMKKAVEDYRSLKGSKILWASTREAFNIYQAEACGCHIITVPDDLIGKLKIRGKSPVEYSLDTVKAFVSDAQKAGFVL